jgi:hypothetical protein
MKICLVRCDARISPSRDKRRKEASLANLKFGGKTENGFHRVEPSLLFDWDPFPFTKTKTLSLHPSTPQEEKPREDGNLTITLSAIIAAAWILFRDYQTMSVVIS